MENKWCVKIVTLAKELGYTQQEIDQVAQKDREKGTKMKKMANEVLARTKSRMHKGFLSLAAFVSLALTATSAQAENCFWTGEGGDNKFSTAANWKDGILPSTDPASPNALVFDSKSGALTNDLDGVVASSIQFSGCGAITLAGNAIAVYDDPAAADDGYIESSDNSVNPVLDLPVDFRTANGDAGSGDLSLRSGNVRFAGGVTANKFGTQLSTIDGHVVLTSATDETSANFTVLTNSSITVDKLVLPSDKLVIEAGGVVTAATARMPGSGGSSFLVKKNNGLFVVTDTLTIGDLDHATTYFMSSEKDLAGVFAFNKLEVLAQSGGSNLLYFQRPMQFVVGSGGINTANCAIEIASSEYLRSSDDYAIACDGNNPVIKASGDLYLDTSDWNDPTVPRTITIEGLVNSTDTTMSSGGVSWTEKLGKLKVIGNGTVRFVNIDGDVKSDVALEMNVGTTLAVPEEGYDHGGAFTVKGASVTKPILVKIGDGEDLLGGSYKVISATSIPDGDPNSYLKFANDMACADKATFRKVDNTIYCDVVTYIWDGGTTPTAWNTENIWRANESATTWEDANYAVFTNKGAQANLTADVAAEKVKFTDDASILAGGGTLTVPEVAVVSNVSATISAPTAGTLEKTGKGTLTLSASRSDQTTLTEGTLAMANGATVDPSKLSLGTDAAKPVTFDYGGQTLTANSTAYLGAGMDVTLTNGVFTFNSQIALTDGNSPAKLTIAKDAKFENSTRFSSFNTDSARTVNIVGGEFLPNSNSDKAVWLMNDSSGRMRINATDGALIKIMNNIFAGTGHDSPELSPKLEWSMVDSAIFIQKGLFFGNQSNKTGWKYPAKPECRFSMTNSVFYSADGFAIGQKPSDNTANHDGYYIAEFDDSIVTSKYCVIYGDRPSSAIHFNGTMLVSSANNDNWISAVGFADDVTPVTVGAKGLVLNTNGKTMKIKANLGGEGAVTKTNTGSLTILSNQTATVGFICAGGETILDNVLTTMARPVTVKNNAKFTVKGTATKSVGGITLEAGSTLDLNGYAADVAAVSVTDFAAPATGTATLKRNNGAFANGTYAVLTKTGVTAADAANLVPNVAAGSSYAYSVDGDTLVLTVFDYDFPSEWHGGVHPVASEMLTKFHTWKDNYSVTAFPLSSEAAFLLGVDPAVGTAAITITAISNDEVETDKIVTIQTANDFTLVNGRLVARSFATLDPATKVAVDTVVTPTGTVRVGDDKTSVTGLDGTAPAQFYQLVVDYGDED